MLWPQQRSGADGSAWCWLGFVAWRRASCLCDPGSLWAFLLSLGTLDPAPGIPDLSSRKSGLQGWEPRSPEDLSQVSVHYGGRRAGLSRRILAPCPHFPHRQDHNHFRVLVCVPCAGPFTASPFWLHLPLSRAILLTEGRLG